MIESSGWKARLANLYGSLTCITFSTASSTSICLGSILVTSPTSPTIVVSSPCEICAVNPNFSTLLTTLFKSSSSVFGLNTIIIFISSSYIQKISHPYKDERDHRVTTLIYCYITITTSSSTNIL